MNQNHSRLRNNLIGTISPGEIKSVEFASELPNKKQGKVLFAKRSDAIACVKKFHGLTLDGRPMDIKLMGENGKDNPFDPNAGRVIGFISLYFFFFSWEKSIMKHMIG
jgi:hypothetical protein